MTEETRPHKPECFGLLDTVFPKGKDGLRHSPQSCIQCAYKTECLTTAMQNESGLRFQEEMVDRAYRLKKISLFERWSKKKSLHRKQMAIEGK
ncbi:MAG: hypothetical protein MUE70_15220 [Desulfobacterales bacterium]|jgi:hypothetical protein|nr:hypothetical protein [Desulfobacterales bacterium]